MSVQREDREAQQIIVLFFRVQNKDAGCDRAPEESHVLLYSCLA